MEWSGVEETMEKKHTLQDRPQLISQGMSLFYAASQSHQTPH